MNIELKLIQTNGTNEIHQLNDFIGESNRGLMKAKVLAIEPQEGTMSTGEYLPIIQMVLGSTVVAATVKGLFDIIKKYFELKQQQQSFQSELDKSKIEQHKIELTVENKEGKKMDIKFASFDEKERDKFFNLIDDIFIN